MLTADDVRSLTPAFAAHLAGDHQRAEALYSAMRGHAFADLGSECLAAQNGQRVKILPDDRRQALRAYVQPFKVLDPIVDRFLLGNPVVKAILAMRQACTFAAADTLIVSFPKCGRTYLRYALGQLAGADEGDFDLLSASRRVGWPAVDVTHDNYPHLQAAEELVPPGPRFDGKRIVFLYRHPLDVMVSLYFQQKHRRPDLIPVEPPTSIEALIEREWGGLESLLAFYKLWGGAEGVLFVGYEALIRDPADHLGRIMDFLGVQPTRPMGEAIARASFSTMQRLERSGASTPIMGSDTADGLKVRRGRAWGFRDYLCEAGVSRWMCAIEAELPPALRGCLEPQDKFEVHGAPTGS